MGDLKTERSTPGAAQTAQALRIEFDRRFADPPPREDDAEAFLLVRAHDARVALRVADLGGVHPCPAVTVVPGSCNAQLGLIGVQGKLTVVYSLAALVASDRSTRSGNWVALSASNASFGLVFDELEGYVNVAGGDVKNQASLESGVLVADVVHIGKSARSVVNIAAIVEEIRKELEELGD